MTWSVTFVTLMMTGMVMVSRTMWTTVRIYPMLTNWTLIRMELVRIYFSYRFLTFFSFFTKLSFSRNFEAACSLMEKNEQVKNNSSILSGYGNHNPSIPSFTTDNSADYNLFHVLQYCITDKLSYSCNYPRTPFNAIYVIELS